MWDLPGPVLKPISPALAGGFLTTVPPGKPDVNHVKSLFIEFVTLLFLFYVLVFWPWGMWDLSSPTRDQTCIPCIGRQSLNLWTAREVPGLGLSVSAPSLWPLLTTEVESPHHCWRGWEFWLTDTCLPGRCKSTSLPLSPPLLPTLRLLPAQEALTSFPLGDDSGPDSGRPPLTPAQRRGEDVSLLPSRGGSLGSHVVSTDSMKGGLTFGRWGWMSQLPTWSPVTSPLRACWGASAVLWRWTLGSPLGRFKDFNTSFRGCFPSPIITKLLALFPVLYSTSLSLSYTPYFVPPTAPTSIEPLPPILPAPNPVAFAGTGARGTTVFLVVFDGSRLVIV